MVDLTLIPYNDKTQLDKVYAAIIVAGAERLRSQGDDFVYPVKLTQQQLDSLRPMYPKHADSLLGEVWLRVGDGSVVVSATVHAYDAKCGRFRTGPNMFQNELVSEGQKGEIADLAERIREQLKERGGLAELATQA